MNGSSTYGLWPLVVLNSLVFIIFAFSFTKPKTSRDWRLARRLFRLRCGAVRRRVCPVHAADAGIPPQVFQGKEIGMTPLPAGSALALTVMVFYALCTLFAVVWPEPFLGFMNALFHGLDFRPLLTQQPYTWGAFFYALLVLGLWGFAIGAFFAWMQRLVSRTRG